MLSLRAAQFSSVQQNYSQSWSRSIPVVNILLGRESIKACRFAEGLILLLKESYCYINKGPWARPLKPRTQRVNKLKHWFGMPHFIWLISLKSATLKCWWKMLGQCSLNLRLFICSGKEGWICECTGYCLTSLALQSRERGSRPRLWQYKCRQ